MGNKYTTVVRQASFTITPPIGIPIDHPKPLYAFPIPLYKDITGGTEWHIESIMWEGGPSLCLMV